MQLPPPANHALSDECPSPPIPAPCRAQHQHARLSGSAASCLQFEIPAPATHPPQTSSPALAHKNPAPALDLQSPKTELDSPNVSCDLRRSEFTRPGNKTSFHADSFGLTAESI